ncbi:MAG: N-acetylmuramoyl-L-alanine amidase [Coriobacteriia bacterium]|nr:N-acetylmuramoyl-L-alanine amidase [Coriobacteriia bacterium]
MCPTRLARKDRARANRRRLLALAGGVLAAGFGAAMALALTGVPADGEAGVRVEGPAPPVETTALVAAAEPTSPPAPTRQVVEVPEVRGKALAEAEMVMSLAGFSVEREADDAAPPDPDRRVTGQTPPAGTKLEAGATIVLSHAVEPEKTPGAPTTQFVVAIDPGHQRRSNMGVEPIGPGSSETKTKVTGGTTGVVSRMPEYEFALKLSNKVKERLEASGVKVVMTRTRHDVDMSNVERAKIANKAGADLAVRIHADGNPDRSMSGISTLCPASNRWTKPISTRSKSAAVAVQRGMVKATGGKDLGIIERGDITGFNWSKVPVILVEAGFMSNPTEDQRLASDGYQDKLADGIVEGVMAYLAG